MPEPRITTFPEKESLYVIHRDRNFNGIGPHRHQFWELILFERGEGKHTINGRAYHFQPGDIALLSPTDIHSITLRAGTTYDSTKVTFSYNIYHNHLNEICCFAQFPILASLCANDFTRAIQLLDMLYDEFNAPHLAGSAACSLNLIELLIILIQRNLSEHKHEQRENASKTRKILLYIQAHFCEPITLTEVSKALNYSPTYFSRLFAKEFGMPFQEYLKNLRLNYAYHLIKYSDQPVIDICYDTGFRSPTYFSKLFKQKYGCSPNHLRLHKV